MATPVAASHKTKGQSVMRIPWYVAVLVIVWPVVALFTGVWIGEQRTAEADVKPYVAVPSCAEDEVVTIDHKCTHPDVADFRWGHWYAE